MIAIISDFYGQQLMNRMLDTGNDDNEEAEVLT